jgi:hypothetical protein
MKRPRRMRSTRQLVTSLKMEPKMMEKMMISKVCRKLWRSWQLSWMKLRLLAIARRRVRLWSNKWLTLGRPWWLFVELELMEPFAKIVASKAVGPVVVVAVVPPKRANALRVAN